MLPPILHQGYATGGRVGRCFLLEWAIILGAGRLGSGAEVGFELLEGGVVPCVGGFAPGVGGGFEVVGEVGAAEAGVGGEVEEGLGAAVEVEDALEAGAGPLDGGEAGGVGVGESGAVVDEHGVEDAVVVGLLGAVAGVEIAGGPFVLEDRGPGDGGGVRGEEGEAGSEGEGVH